jgi:4-hydroxybenzoate polyprenyltransferase
LLRSLDGFYRLTVAEARRIAETTSFREIHRGMVRARRGVIGGALLVLAGVLVAWAGGVLTPGLLEFFVVAIGGAFGSACIGVVVLERMFRLVADRFDDLLNRPSTGSPS